MRTGSAPGSAAAAGVVAIEPDRLRAFGDALLRVADDVLDCRLDALRVLDALGRGAPAAVIDLGATAARVRELGLDTRRRLDVVRRLPWEAYPMPTSVVLGRSVLDPFLAPSLAADLLTVARFGEDLTPALDRFLAVARDPLEAAAALEAIGVDGFRQLYAVAEREHAGDEALQGRIEAVSAVLFAASTTVDRPGGLARAFVDDLLGVRDAAWGPEPAEPGGTRSDRDSVAALDRLLTGAGVGQYLAEATTSAVVGGRATLVTAAGRLIAVAGLFTGVVGALERGGDGLGPGLASGALGVVGAFTSGPIGWAAAGLGIVLWLVSGPSGRGTPRQRTYPAGQRSPGGHGSETWLTGSGAPVAPNGV